MHIVVAGPTGSGKTLLADFLAEHFKSYVVNLDPQQAFKNLKILTSSPTSSHTKLCDIFDENETTSVAQWNILVRKTLDEFYLENPKKNRHMIFCGGSGFYIEVLFKGLAPSPASEEDEITKYKDFSNEELFRELQKIDPDIANRIPINDRFRIIRAISVKNISNKAMFEWQKMERTGMVLDEEKTFKILVLPERSKLREKLKERLDQMIENGAVEEVAKALQNPHRGAEKIIGFKELSSYLSKEITLNQAKEIIVNKTRQYAKRQSTWFRNRYQADLVIDNFCDNVDCQNNALRKVIDFFN